MSHYPIEKGMVNIQYRGKIIPTDINDSFWEETKAFETEEEFDKWLAHHPFGWHVIQVEEIEEM
jgi:hypothetical protein